MQAHELAPPIVDELLYVRDELVAAQQNYEATRTQRLAATAEIAYRDELVDRAVTHLADAALQACDGRRDAPLFKFLFPIDLNVAIASTAGHRQNEFVRGLIGRLEEDPRCQPLVELTAEVKARQTELEGALARREACFEPESRAVARRNEAIEAACRGYNRCHARLQLCRVDPLLIESLYPVLTHHPTVDPEGFET